MTDAYGLVCERGVKITATDCYEFQGYRNADGYGQVRPGRGRLVRAHRAVAAQVLDRDLQPSEVVRHSCDNPPCVNPAHLQVGTQADNLADMFSRGRDGKADLKVCPNGHPYPEDRPKNVSKNRCRECARERNLRYYQRKRALA